MRSFLVVFLAGCACWQPANPKYDSPACLALRQAVACTVTAAEAKAAGLLPVVQSIWGVTPNWATVESTLLSMGFSDALCIMAALEHDVAPNTLNAYLRREHPRLRLVRR